MLGAQAQQSRIQSQSPVSTAISVNYESDPVLARIRALNSQSVGNAQSEAMALKKQAVIDTGLADVGAQIGLDAGTLEAARANPFSTSATIQRTAQERGRELDESLNQQNLFYSGHRAGQLGDLARNTAEAQSRTASDLRSLLGQADAGVLDAQQRAAAEEQAALEAAAEQARQDAYLQSLLNPPVTESELPFEDPALGGTGPIGQTWDPFVDPYDPVEGFTPGNDGYTPVAADFAPEVPVANQMNALSAYVPPLSAPAPEPYYEPYVPTVPYIDYSGQPQGPVVPEDYWDDVALGNVLGRGWY
jgi:hypothetical protein